ncbi:hypothetical protein H5410_050098 [Solanum commersonii]|uniref:Uncharacterized protein n=1 Tax=Solanum commersonii TaxID=4109 RepID=A0A9J5WVV8_SOLCO|nr:hypothetical protein H5410_050098 [Solanum commersonii]
MGLATVHFKEQMVKLRVLKVMNKSVLHNYLREYQSSDEIFMVYEHEDIVAEDIDQQMAQSNNVGSSSRSHDREMQVQLEEIVRTM